MMSRRFEPGSRAMAMGQRIFNFGKAFFARKGSGGFGEPTTREVVQGMRLSMPYGRSVLALRGTSAAGTSAAEQRTISTRIWTARRMRSIPSHDWDASAAHH